MLQMKRHAYPLVEELLTLFPCVVIVGARQTGKTTLLRQLSAPWKILDLEKLADLAQITRDPDLFLRLNPSAIAFDEGQRLPALFPALRVAIDSNREGLGRYIVTGSNSPELIRAISESLAGRVAILELSPFSPAEAYAQPPSAFFTLLTERRAPRDFLELPLRIDLAQLFTYWLHGGYPEPWIRNQSRFRTLWMQNYLQTYLDRDLLQLFPGLDRQKFRLFLQLLSNLSGNIINYSEVARALGVSQPTAREYFHIAHGTFLWRHLPPYEKNATKRVVKHPKGYLRDSGLLHYLLHVKDLDALQAHPRMGQSWEGLAIEAVLRGLHAKSVAFDAFHYRTGAGAEIDLVIEGEFGVIPIEVKHAQQPTNRFRAIRDFVLERDCPLGIIINNDERVRQFEDRLIGVPLAAL